MGRDMSDVQSDVLGRTIVDRIHQLAQISQSTDGLTRLFLTPEHRLASDLLMRWMQNAGMSVRLDEIGNVVGRYEGEAAGCPALLLGSHYDTVRNAGRWDGPLGIITAIACVERLYRQGRRMPFAIEIVGFADEEGTRFSSTLLGSRAFAGTWDNLVLSATDRSSMRMDEAMHLFGLDPEQIKNAAQAPSQYLAYIELHIEQGPVLESAENPVGVVTGISGATRLRVRMTGIAGHAGTVPMKMRQDALAGAAECVVMIEALCRDDPQLFGTVGQLDVLPGATNVIPGSATFSIDLRSISDSVRQTSLATIVGSIHDVAQRRGLTASIETTHEHRTVDCAPWLQSQVAESIKRSGYRVLHMPSGAGHDAMAVADLTDVGMIFVRCRGGISHHPDEHVAEVDADAGARVLFDVIENFSPKQDS